MSNFRFEGKERNRGLRKGFRGLRETGDGTPVFRELQTKGKVGREVGLSAHDQGYSHFGSTPGPGSLPQWRHGWSLEPL